MTQAPHSTTEATTTNQHPEIDEFVRVVERANAVRLSYEKASTELVALLEQLKSLDAEAHFIRAKLGRSGLEGLVDGHGWPGLNDDGLLVQKFTRIMPFAASGARWPAL